MKNRTGNNKLKRKALAPVCNHCNLKLCIENTIEPLTGRCIPIALIARIANPYVVQGRIIYSKG